MLAWEWMAHARASSSSTSATSFNLATFLALAPFFAGLADPHLAACVPTTFFVSGQAGFSLSSGEGLAACVPTTFFVSGQAGFSLPSGEAWAGAVLVASAHLQATVLGQARCALPLSCPEQEALCGVLSRRLTTSLFSLWGRDSPSASQATATPRRILAS